MHGSPLSSPLSAMRRGGQGVRSRGSGGEVTLSDAERGSGGEGAQELSLILR